MTISSFLRIRHLPAVLIRLAQESMKPRTAMIGIATAAMVALMPFAAAAQPLSDEAGVRAALSRCVATWNRHVPKAFADACVTDDVWFTEVDDSYNQRFKGRAKMLSVLDQNIRRTVLQWEVVSLQALSDGTVAAQLRERVRWLPRKQGKYAQSFDSDPSYARLRREGKQWKLLFFHLEQRLGARPAGCARPAARREDGGSPARYRPAGAARLRTAGLRVAVGCLGA